MARPREFDEAAALDGAIECFWRRGYAATSVRDLATEMGVGCTSLYNAFGNKRAVFVRALERYLDGSMRERIRRFETTRPPKQAIQGFIQEIIRRSLADGDCRGCLLVNSAMEVAPHDRGLRRAIAERLGELEAFFRRSVVAAQRNGTVPAERNAVELARLLLGVVLGIRVLARTNPDGALLRGLARPALALLDRDPWIHGSKS
jgi:TetR/AcrR family transcriptional regulator, transcriptional repressor for nem operon